MLITDFMVGRDEKGTPLCLVVKDVLMTDCVKGKTSLVVRAARKDLVQEFIQDGDAVEYLAFPGLPDDVAELLQAGCSLSIIDIADSMVVDCQLDLPETKVASK